MNISKISFSVPNYSKPVTFGDNNSKAEYENPVSRETEKNLAILNASVGAAVVGLVIGGLSMFLFKKGSKLPIWAGIGATIGSLAVSLPPAIYNRKVSAFVKQKEMDVFSRDRNLKSNLTEEVDKEVQNPEVSLDKKLDDNLKLQMANRGGALGIANITPQS